MGKVIDYESFLENMRMKGLIFNEKMVCTWAKSELPDGDIAWDSDCGETWCFPEGDPQSNRIHFCHGCGGVVVVDKKEEIEF